MAFKMKGFPMLDTKNQVDFIPYLPKTYRKYKKQFKKDAAGEKSTGSDLYKNVMLTKEKFKFYKNQQKQLIGLYGS